ncbi:hypothetical protein [Microbacterium sp. B19(2022)]|nr:hypothetical protein [Microbacterium sp. B19(2022)]
MTRAELGAVLRKLNLIAVELARQSGYDRGVTADGRHFATWTV